MTQQKITGYVIVALILAALYWLLTQGTAFLHGTDAAAGAGVAQSGAGGQTATVQTTMLGGGSNAPTTTTWPCSDCA